MKVKSLLLGFIVLLISSNLFSQTGFKPGYIITHSNDTVGGLILFRSDQNNYKSCTFKASIHGEKVTYTPKDISGYRLNEGKLYVSKKVPVYKDTLLLFTEYILKGRASFYFVTLKGIYHYYIETAGGLTEITQPEETYTINAHTYVTKSLALDKLQAALSDCPQIIPELDKVHLTHKSIIELGQKYHKLTCDNGDCIVFERSIKHSGVSYGFMTGYSYSFFNFGGLMKSEGSGSFVAGITTEVSNIASRDERVSLRIDPVIQYKKTLVLTPAPGMIYAQGIDYNGNEYYLDPVYTDTIANIIYVKSLKADVKLLSLQVPLTLNYNFGVGKLHYFCGVGPVCSFILSQNRGFKYRFWSEVYGKSFRTVFFGGTVEAGVKYKINDKCSLISGLSFDKMISYNINNLLRLRYTSCCINVGLRF